jgi:hypothetical protein
VNFIENLGIGNVNYEIVDKELFYEKMKNYSYTFDYNIISVSLSDIKKKRIYVSKKLVKPINPEEIMDNLGKIIPSVVFEAVNYLLKEKYSLH